MPDASCITCHHPAHAQRCEYPITEDSHWGPSVTATEIVKLCNCDTKAPGLHQVGPAPWDYVYNPAKNQRVSFVGRDGKMFTGTVTAYTENRQTGEFNLTVRQFQDPIEDEVGHA